MLLVILCTILFVYSAEVKKPCPFATCGECKNWNDELRFSKLEAAVEHLTTKVSALEVKGRETEAELNVMRKMLKASNTGWSLKRTELIFPQLYKLKLHQVQPTYIAKLPLTPLPSNTKAVIISVFCNFGNGGNSHAYLHGYIQQKGNKDGGRVKFQHTHYAVYANTFSNEVLVPWDSSVSNEVEVQVTSSYHTGGANNWYRITMVGYITA